MSGREDLGRTSLRASSNRRLAFRIYGTSESSLFEGHSRHPDGAPFRGNGGVLFLGRDADGRMKAGEGKPESENDENLAVT